MKAANNMPDWKNAQGVLIATPCTVDMPYDIYVEVTALSDEELMKDTVFDWFSPLSEEEKRSVLTEWVTVILRTCMSRVVSAGSVQIIPNEERVIKIE